MNVEVLKLAAAAALDQDWPTDIYPYRGGERELMILLMALFASDQRGSVTKDLAEEMGVSL